MENHRNSKKLNKDDLSEKKNIVIPGHVVKPAPSFFEEPEEEKEKIPGVHVENVGGTAENED